MKLVLKPTSTENDVRLVAQIRGWTLQHDLAPTDTSPRQLHFLTAHETQLIYVYDHLLDTRYLVLSGSAALDVAEAVQAGLEVYSTADLDRLQDPALDTEAAIALVNVAATMGESDFSAPIFEAIRRAFCHADATVQRAALFAVTYLRWRAFRDELELLAVRAPQLAADITSLLATLDQHGWR